MHVLSTHLVIIHTIMIAHYNYDSMKYNCAFGLR